MTHGVAWGDYDGDGLPDLYVTNHLHDAQLFRNLGKGKFADVTRDIFPAVDVGGDKHGAAWADVDNDGRPDLVQLTGAVMGQGAEPKRLMMNINGRFKNVAEEVGIANPEGRTRSPLWLDVDGDGRLDLIEGAEARLDDQAPPFTFLQRGSRFEASLKAIGFASRGVPFCILTELTGDAHPEPVCRVIGKNRTVQVFDTATQPARELDLLPVTAFEDITAGDFDNDGAIDVFLARRNPPGKVAFGRPTLNVAIADLQVSQAELAQPTEFSLRAAGRLHVVVAPKQPGGVLSPERVRIGASAKTPTSLEFQLDPQAPESSGMESGPSDGVQLRIGFEAPDRWRIAIVGQASTEKPSRDVHVQIAITADGPIRELQAAGEAEHAEQAPQRLFMNRAGKLVEEGDKRGVNKQPVAAMNVVAADFNNDMWLDLFILGSGEIGMHSNLLLLNRGDGSFEVRPTTGSAEGPLRGVGDSVTTADFDGDGFVDLLIATGGSMGRSLGLPSDTGGYHLFRNTGNGNRWLEIDLEGTRSNRDGIGARVVLTSGGVTQTRVQDDGIHNRSQNHSRLHFGLAKNERADRIAVHWPSGVTQELTGVAANQVLRIVEPKD